MKTTLFFVLCIVAVLAQPGWAQRRLTKPKQPTKLLTASVVASVVPPKADLHVTMEALSVVRISGGGIKKVFALDSAKLQIMPFSANSFALVAKESFAGVKELLIVLADSSMRLKVGFLKRADVPLDYYFQTSGRSKNPPPVYAAVAAKAPATVEKAICDRITAEPTARMRITEEAHDIYFRLVNVYYDKEGSQMFMEFWVSNHSAMPFTSDQIVISIVSKPKRGNITSQPLPTQECACNEPLVVRDTKRFFILSIPYTPLRSDETFECRLLEKTRISRGRNVTLYLSAKKLNKTSVSL